MKCKNLVLQNFPFLEDDFDALTDYQLFSKMTGYVKNLDLFIRNELGDALTKYINEQFNNIMMNALYNSETETLVLYLDGGNE